MYEDTKWIAEGICISSRAYSRPLRKRMCCGSTPEVPLRDKLLETQLTHKSCPIYYNDPAILVYKTKTSHM